MPTKSLQLYGKTAIGISKRVIPNFILFAPPAQLLGLPHPEEAQSPVKYTPTHACKTKVNPTGAQQKSAINCTAKIFQTLYETPMSIALTILK